MKLNFTVKDLENKLDIKGDMYKDDYKNLIQSGEVCAKFINNLISNMHFMFAKKSLLCTFGVLSLHIFYEY